MSPRKYEIDMYNGPLMGKILLFVVPLICSSLLQLLFNAADIVVVGKFEGSDALAAMGSTSSLINLLLNLFIGLSVMPMVVALIGASAFRIVWVLTIFKVVGTIESLYISYPISWGITFMTHILCWFIVARRRLSRIKVIEME